MERRLDCASNTQPCTLQSGARPSLASTDSDSPQDFVLQELNFRPDLLRPLEVTSLVQFLKCFLQFEESSAILLLGLAVEHLSSITKAAYRNVRVRKQLGSVYTVAR